MGAWLAQHERNPAWLVRQTGADPGTIGDFLNGNRWPKLGTQGRIEKAIGWRPGMLTAIADGATPPAFEVDTASDPEPEEPLVPLLTEATDEELAAEVLRRMNPQGGLTRGQRQGQQGLE